MPSPVAPPRPSAISASPRSGEPFRIGVLCLFLVALAADDAWKQAYVPKTDAWKTVPQRFAFNNDSEPETLDPGRMTGVPESRIALGLFEGLLTNDPRTLEPRPGVAERWTVSADGTEYVFHLRADARWSDGTAVTAADFVASWRRVLDPATAADYAYLLDFIAGAEALRTGKGDPAAFGAEAVDARTLRVRLRAPCPWFLELCAFHTYMPVRVDLIAEHGERWTRPGVLVGNGPFALAEWEPRSRIVLRRSETYWDRPFVKLEEVVITPHDNLDTATNLFLAGELEWVPTLPWPKLDQLRRNPDYYSMPYLGTYFFRLNVGKPPFDDVHVRRAIALAIDRRLIAEQVARGGQTARGSLCPPMRQYQPIAGPALDLERARRELAASRYAGKVPPVELHFNTSELHKPIAEAVAQQLKAALGIDVVLRNQEWKTYLATQDQREYQMSRSAWIGDYDDPDTFFSLFLSGGGNNKTGWAHPEYDRLVRASQVEVDPARRQELLQQAERLLVEEECPIVCVYTYVTQGLLSERVMGWERNHRDLHPYQYLWVEP